MVFSALDPIRLLQGRGIEPAEPRRAFGDDPAAVVDQAVDPVGRGTLQRNLADVHLGRVLQANTVVLMPARLP